MPHEKRNPSISSRLETPGHTLVKGLRLLCSAVVVKHATHSLSLIYEQHGKFLSARLYDIEIAVTEIDLFDHLTPTVLDLSTVLWRRLEPRGRRPQDVPQTLKIGHVMEQLIEPMGILLWLLPPAEISRAATKCDGFDTALRQPVALPVENDRIVPPIEAEERMPRWLIRGACKSCGQCRRVKRPRSIIPADPATAVAATFETAVVVPVRHQIDGNRTRRV